MWLPQVGLASIATRTVRLDILAYIKTTRHSLGDGLNQEFQLKKLAQLLILSLQAAYVCSLFANWILPLSGILRQFVFPSFL